MSKKEQDELDVSSPTFNPLKALKNPDKVKLPYPFAAPLDNLSRFVETPDGIFPKPTREPQEKKPKRPPPKATTSKDESDVKKEDIEEHLRKCKNVISRMENTVKGPLTFIKKCMDEKLRVKVYTRGAVQVRGFCIGFVVAFDKHLNLVLKDVFETWTRKRKRKTPFLGPVPSENSERCDISEVEIEPRERERLKTINVKKPKIIVRKRLKRREICERHIDQVLIRGEQIVIVTLDTNTDDRMFKSEAGLDT